MAQITLDVSDAAELAEMLTFLADWLSGSQRPVLGKSLAAYVSHAAYKLDDLRADLRPVRLPARRDRRRTTLLQPDPDDHHDQGAARALDRITRITPSMYSY